MNLSTFQTAVKNEYQPIMGMVRVDSLSSADRAAVQSLFYENYPLGDDSWIARYLVLYAHGTLQNDVDQAELTIDNLITQYFNQPLPDKITDCKEACMKGFAQLYLTDLSIARDREDIENIDALEALYKAYVDKWDNFIRNTIKTSAFTDIENWFKDIEAAGKDLLNRIVYKDHSDPPVVNAPDKILDFFASFLPSGLANVATWIVKYLFFGWLWGRWL